MKIAIGADHAGFLLKEQLRQELQKKGYQAGVVDEGDGGGGGGHHSTAACDYPDMALAVAHDVAEGRADRGILVCSTGVGMSIAANKVPGIRAALGTSVEETYLIRSHNDANILTLGARYTDELAAATLVHAFLNTEFEDGRHSRRLAKIAALEPGSGAPPEKSTFRPNRSG